MECNVFITSDKDLLNINQANLFTKIGALHVMKYGANYHLRYFVGINIDQAEFESMHIHNMLKEAVTNLEFRVPQLTAILDEANPNEVFVDSGEM